MTVQHPDPSAHVSRFTFHASRFTHHVWADRTLTHLRALAEDIGPRPSTGEGERQAADYALRVLSAAGLAYPHLEFFTSGRSTYRPYAWAFGAGLLGHLLHFGARRVDHRPSSAVAAALNALGAWAFYREATLSPHWGRRLSPTGRSQNVVAIARPSGVVKRRVVLLGHLDTHRTPIFYSSPRWLWVFAQSLTATMVSLVGSSLAYAALALLARRAQPAPRLSPLPLLLPAAAFQAWALAMVLLADRTPYTPGANDNASGAATVLALAERLAQEPLRHTEVWLLNTGCEELGAYGAAAFLDRHGDELRDAYFINFDQLGVGAPTLNLSEGLIRPIHYTPELLDLARQAACQRPPADSPAPPPPSPAASLLGPEHPGGAYTDTWHIITRGFQGIILDSRPPEGEGDPSGAHWHQMSDTVDKIDLDCLARAHQWAWNLLHLIDSPPGAPPRSAAL